MQFGPGFPEVDDDLLCLLGVEVEGSRCCTMLPMLEPAPCVGPRNPSNNPTIVVWIRQPLLANPSNSDWTDYDIQ